MSDVKAPAKGLYLRASLIIAALTLVGFLIAMVNEDVSMRIAAATVFPAGVLIFSYPASLISRRMLARSDKLRAAGKVLFFILHRLFQDFRLTGHLPCQALGQLSQGHLSPVRSPGKTFWKCIRSEKSARSVIFRYMGRIRTNAMPDREWRSICQM